MRVNEDELEVSRTFLAMSDARAAFLRSCESYQIAMAKYAATHLAWTNLIEKLRLKYSDPE